ncbi:methionyl-tRNA synthetase [Pseudovibrio ascidiaceicola]|uniref:Methionine--tRNA ligase n=1 Tax=Pseudovibrio ascidiaceicola TaxID=285279 RepID=A0A1I4D3E1_9HYPH|nr:methionine--tRNA ligase [Pseudovibrio ascidiaceicola]SFK87249.1 methionyl-tRNA synthetase [Pseudovibrio ascidiaceicola]
MTEKSPFYITTAISYPNGEPHIGHAYEAIATDVLARFQKLDGREVHFLTGTDVHGQKMLQTAVKEGMSPSDLADKNSKLFREMVEMLGCSNDDFIQTNEERHYKSCQAIWQKMADSGDIYKDSYAGWYSVRDEAYYQEGETEVREDGVRYGPQGTPVEWVQEESYFFRLSAYEDKLIELYEKNPDFVGPNARRNEVMSFVKGGLKDLSISRTTFDWGIPVPGDEKHVMYVWVDALTNYLTALGYPDLDGEMAKFWPANAHIIGKDIIRFHAVYWPAFLMSAGVPLPERVFAHGFLFNSGEKMSKSLGNVIAPRDLVETYGLDQIRYFFLREVPFGQDGNYNHEAMVNRINADLANDIGNLAQRSLSMIFKNCEGKLPVPGEFSDEDKAILQQADEMLEKCRGFMAKQEIHHALACIWSTVGEANRYFASQEPWALKKTDPERMATVLYTTAEIIRQVGILAQPVMPGSAAKLLDLLVLNEDERSFALLGEAGRLQGGRDLPKPQGVFPRYVEPETAE